MEVFKAKNAVLKHGITAAKARAFKDLLECVDDDPWGLGYKLASKKLRRWESTLDEPKLLSSIVTELFPRSFVAPLVSFSVFPSICCVPSTSPTFPHLCLF